MVKVVQYAGDSTAFVHAHAASCAGQLCSVRRRKDRREDPLKRKRGFERATKRESANEPLTQMEKAAEKHRPKVKRGGSFQPKVNVRKNKGRQR